MPASGYFDVVFAVSGTRAAVPDGIQSDGSVSYTEGYGINYTLNPATNPSALEIEQTKMNQLFYDITAAIQYQQQGLPAPFITSAMNGGSPFSYGQYATVIYGGIAYISNTSANTDTPPSSKWNVLNISSSNQFTGSTITGTANAIVVGSLNPAAGFDFATPNQTLVFTPTATNTGATTVAVTPVSLAATAVKKVSGMSLVPLAGGEFVNGVPAYISTDPTASCFVLQAGPALGTIAPLNIGNNVANDGSGNAVATVPPLALAGTSEVFTAAQWGALVARSNSGTGMTDTLPGTSGAMPAGWYIELQNTDATGVDVVSVGAGGTIFMGNQNLSVTGFPILPGEVYSIQSQGSGNYEIARISSATLHTAPTGAAPLNFKSITTSTTAVTMTADSAVVQDASGNTRRLQNVNVSYTIGTTGANHLDTGAIAASTWYYEYIIYNPLTNTVASLLSLSATAPTLPAGYTYFKCMGEQRTDGSSHLIGLQANDADRQYLVGTNLSAARQMASGSSGSVSVPTWTPVAVSNFVPPTAVKINVSCNGSSSGTTMCSPNNSYGSNSSSINPPPIISTLNSSTLSEIVLESSNIYYASNQAGGLYCIGWKTKLI